MDFMKAILLHFIRRLTDAAAGIIFAFKHDRSFRLQVLIGIPGACVVWYLGWPMSDLDLFLVIIATLLVLITELQNSAFEAALDRLHPDIHQDIKHSKDMAAGAVLIAALFAAGVACFVIFT